MEAGEVGRFADCSSRTGRRTHFYLQLWHLWQLFRYLVVVASIHVPIWRHVGFSLAFLCDMILRLVYVLHRCHDVAYSVRTLEA